MLDGGSIPPISTKKVFMDKRKECLEQEINRLKSLDPTQFHYPERIACLEQRLKNLSDGDDQVSTA
jgi:hypothetical protein